jgi:hypothetical protein
VKDYLDGPGLAAWVEQQGIVMTHRNVQPWRRGACVSVWRADYFLTKHGIHLHALPDWLWIDKCDSCEIDMAEVEKAVLTSIRAGDYPRYAAKRWNIPADLIESWSRDAGVDLPVDSLYLNRAVRRERERVAREKAAA